MESTFSEKAKIEFGLSRVDADYVLRAIRRQLADRCAAIAELSGRVNLSPEDVQSGHLEDRTLNALQMVVSHHEGIYRDMNAMAILMDSDLRKVRK